MLYWGEDNFLQLVHSTIEPNALESLVTHDSQPVATVHGGTFPNKEIGDMSFSGQGKKTTEAPDTST